MRWKQWLNSVSDYSHRMIVVHHARQIYYILLDISKFIIGFINSKWNFRSISRDKLVFYLSIFFSTKGITLTKAGTKVGISSRIMLLYRCFKRQIILINSWKSEAFFIPLMEQHVHNIFYIIFNRIIVEVNWFLSIYRYDSDVFY